MPKKLKYKTFLTNLTYISILILTVCCCVIFKNPILPTETLSSKITSPSMNLFIISIKKSQLENEAKVISKDMQSQNLGGFIWKYENYYHIISSIHTNKNDATLVQNSLEMQNNISCEILNLSCNGITFNSTFSSIEKKTLHNAFDIFYKYYLNLYDLAVCLDTNIYNEISAKIEINNFHHDIEKVIANTKLLFQKENENLLLTKLIQNLEKILAVSQNLCGEISPVKGQNLSSLIKYSYCKILKIYFDFCENTLTTKAELNSAFSIL